MSDGAVFLKSIRLTNFLSYGEMAAPVELGALNVVIGPNGSGKSNLLEAISLLRAAPVNIQTVIREGGGIRDWLRKGGDSTRVAKIEAVFQNPVDDIPLSYELEFTEAQQRFFIVNEAITDSNFRNGPEIGNFYYKFGSGHSSIRGNQITRAISHADLDLSASILSQRNDPDHYPELAYLANNFAKIRLYREWHFGRSNTPRIPQKTDLPNVYLASDGGNLGLVLNWLRRDPLVKRRVLDALRKLYDGIEDFDLQIEGGTVQVFLTEGEISVPATRLSDGTLRYLCLLAILCHPSPGPLVCIEEPELALHPDILPGLAELLVEASERTQLIVTTHSDVLVDAFTDRPEVVLVTERTEDGTTLTRLSPEKLKPWLEKYSLGQLWTRGDFGGNRW